MQETKKSDNSSLNKKHFAKFHEKIQNKYIEMQKKLDKSRSVDSLYTLGDDYVYKFSRHSSYIDIKETDEVFESAKSDKKVVKYNVIVEDINKHDVTFRDCLETNVYESEVTFVEPENDSEAFFEDLESPHEANLESKVNEEPVTPPPRISIRDKIGTRITAAREKRKEAKKRMRDSQEKVEKFCLNQNNMENWEGTELILTNSTKLDNIKLDVIKKKNKVASVTVALIEATESENEAAGEEKRLLHCRIRLGSEKRKSKTAKCYNNMVTWQEIFHFNLYDDNILDITLWEKDYFIGRKVLDLSEVEKEKTHRMRLNLEDGLTGAQIFILLTISGITDDTFLDIDEYKKEHERMRKKYYWFNLSEKEVGWVSIFIYGAKGLAGNDCYCVVELDNERLRTPNVPKTCNPNWMKILAFKISEVAAILKITVINDEKKPVIVGMLDIPLFRIKNGEKKWYALKDSSLRERAKGNNARILLEINLYYNVIRASLRSITPKEPLYLVQETDFSRQILIQNWSRCKVILDQIMSGLRVVRTAFEWESKLKNSIALSLWLLFWWFHKPWMFPLLLLIPFFYHRRPSMFHGRSPSTVSLKERLSIIQTITSITDMVQNVQNGLGRVASVGESIPNLFNYTVPFLSKFAILVIIFVSLLLYFVPARYIFMAWGIHKYTRKLLRPNRKPNNEVLDLLSRLPDDETLQNCEELPLLDLPPEDQFEAGTSQRSDQFS